MGQSDIANTNQTALYALNRIGNHGEASGELGNGLVLQGGSTLVLESAGVELAAFRSLDDGGNEADTKTKNTLLLDTGTLLRIFLIPIRKKERSTAR